MHGIQMSSRTRAPQEPYYVDDTVHLVQVLALAFHHYNIEIKFWKETGDQTHP